jgi:hypothetical protein
LEKNKRRKHLIHVFVCLFVCLLKKKEKEDLNDSIFIIIGLPIKKNLYLEIQNKL